MEEQKLVKAHQGHQVRHPCISQLSFREVIRKLFKLDLQILQEKRHSHTKEKLQKPNIKNSHGAAGKPLIALAASIDLRLLWPQFIRKVQRLGPQLEIHARL